MQIYDCESLDDFWECISPIGSIFRSPQYTFIYRGQSDSDWQLTPAVYRRDVIERYKSGLAGALKDHSGQTFFEFMLLQSFIYHCDLRGLPIPFDSMEFRDYFSLQRIMNMNSIENSAWPQDRVLPLMAMAQHHGVPTRLLDWTSNSMVACYFSASGAVSATRAKKGKKIAVFGLTFNEHDKKLPYRYVRVPGSTSPNIPAQGGSFLLIDNYGRRGEEFTYDVCLEDKLRDGGKLIKVTLPIQFAGDLLLRCHQFGISAASIYPGYDGVAKAVMERNLAQSFVDRLD